MYALRGYPEPQQTRTLGQVDRLDTQIGAVPVVAAAGAVKAVQSIFTTPSHVRAAGELATLVPKAVAGDKAAYDRIVVLSQHGATSKTKSLAAAALKQVDAARAAAKTVAVQAAKVAAPIAADVAINYARPFIPYAAAGLGLIVLSMFFGRGRSRRRR